MGGNRSQTSQIRKEGVAENQEAGDKLEVDIQNGDKCVDRSLQDLDNLQFGATLRSGTIASDLFTPKKLTEVQMLLVS